MKCFQKANVRHSRGNGYYGNEDREETQPIIRNDVTNYTQEDTDGGLVPQSYDS